MSGLDAEIIARLAHLERGLERSRRNRIERECRRNNPRRKQVACTLTKAEYDALETAARRAGVSPTEAARRALQLAYPAENSSPVPHVAPAAPFTRQQVKSPLDGRTKLDVQREAVAAQEENQRRVSGILRDARPR